MRRLLAPSVIAGTLIAGTLAAGCAPPPCACDTGDTAPAVDSGDTGGDGPVTTWRYESWTPPTEWLDASVPVDLVRAGGDDGAYLLDAGAGRVLYLSRAYVQPSGAWCLGGDGTPEECEGVVLSAGSIPASGAARACGHADGSRLYLTRADGRVEVVGTTRAGPSWRTWNRVYRVLDHDPDADPDISGPCAPAPGGLVLSSDQRLVRVAVGEALERRVEVEVAAAPVDLAATGDWLVTRDVAGTVELRRLASLVREDELAREATAVAVDRDRDVVWVGASGRVLGFSLGPDGAEPAGELELEPEVVDLGVDERSGLLHVLRCGDPGCELVLTDGRRVLARTPAGQGAEALVPPGGTGDAAVLSGAEGGGLDLRVHLALPAPEPRPDLSVFLVSTLEQPFSDLDMPCAEWDGYLSRLRSNAALLAGLDVPVAIGVTWEFLSKSADCGEERVLGELDAHGFELGVMVHSRPCYSCTDGDVPGESPVTCGRGHPDYAPPGDPDACWPSDPDYCDPGDDACWLDQVRVRVEEVDGALPGGAGFIHGADRHSLWGWDWVRGYREMPRADGSAGYPFTLFVADWVYPEVASLDDPRGKDPAPWDPELASSTWFSADLESWDRPSAFSTLLVMPGNSVAIKRLAEWQGTGLTVVQLGEEGVRAGLDSDDTEVATALLRHAATRRPEGRPSTFYVHVPDLSGWEIDATTPGGDRGIDLLQGWADAVRDIHGAAWRRPSDVRRDAGRGG